jgi:predicted Ser/Thr protein kinase
LVQGRFKGKLALKQKTKVIRYSRCVMKSKANNLRSALRLMTLVSIEVKEK